MSIKTSVLKRTWAYRNKVWCKQDTLPTSEYLRDTSAITRTAGSKLSDVQESFTSLAACFQGYHSSESAEIHQILKICVYVYINITILDSQMLQCYLRKFKGIFQSVLNYSIFQDSSRISLGVWMKNASQAQCFCTILRHKLHGWWPAGNQITRLECNLKIFRRMTLDGKPHGEPKFIIHNHPKFQDQFISKL